MGSQINIRISRRGFNQRRIQDSDSPNANPPPLPPLADLERKPEMPSRRVISTGAKGKKRSEVVTGDIGYTPRQGFKWKGKSVITNSKLEKMRTEKVIQTRSAAAAKSQGKNISTRKTHVL
ncbi:hypothetical protein T459_29866 [Capsicum annuum]|uniref:Uncharacterized protein n=1 Tax=Capsicum annuum TaxID=4072 RepID=A0A2G2Y794_CAPAN|nr:hypothetical protein T459_29866 [Capsicum annuum]